MSSETERQDFEAWLLSLGVRPGHLTHDSRNWAWRAWQAGAAHPAEPLRQAQQETALQRFRKIADEELTAPAERLRAFCSFAMSGQDWLDVEPFFDALTAIAEPPRTVTGDGVPSVFTTPSIGRNWSEFEAGAIRAYGQRCWAAGRSCGFNWISVEDRLPEKNTEVFIVFRDVPLAATGQYTAAPTDMWGWCFPSENDPEETGPITHWMPILEHPVLKK